MRILDNSLTFLKNKFNLVSLRSKFLITMIALSCIPMLTLGFVDMKTSQRIIKNNYIESSETNLQTLSKNIDLTMEPFIQLARYKILANANIQKFLINIDNNRMSYSEASDVILLLTRLITENKYIEGIYIIANDRKLYYSAKNSSQNWYINMLPVEKLISSEWYGLTRRKKGYDMFFGHDVLEEQLPAAQRSGKYFSCTKLISNLDEPGRQIGTMVLRIRKDILIGLFPDILENTMCIIDNKAGLSMVYKAGRMTDTDAIISAINTENEANSGKISPYLASRHNNSLTGWDIYNIIDRSILDRKSLQVGLQSIAGCAVVLVVTNILFIFLSNAFNRPLKKLESVINRFGEGDREIKEEFDDSEIGRIGKQFERMVKNNVELNERLMLSKVRQHEAELMSLQERINPHFLYNTLDSLYWMALIKGEKEIANLAVSLSNVFKLTLSKGNNLITVREELELVRNYLNIQLLRFKNKLNVVIDVDEDILEYKLPKLLIQPVVENAVIHGIEPKMDSGSVVIKGLKKDGMLVFEILDDGVGVVSDKIWRSGYGVNNLIERVRLFYGGEPYGVFRERNEPYGTKVIIKVKAVIGPEEMMVCSEQ